MFTGLVETLGTVSALTPDAETGTTLTISLANSSLPDEFLSDAHLGDSISINGTCLTITSFTSSTFKVGVAPETLRRTNLGTLKENDRVNLERAVRSDTRLGGHIVQGHVDTVAAILDKRKDGEAVVFRFAPRKRDEHNVLRYIVEKGFIALDGASLTVTAVDDKEGWFEIMLISYSQEKVVMSSKEVGGEVNVEIDLVGKLVEKSVHAYFEEKEGSGGKGVPAVLEKMVERIVEQKMKGMKA